MNVLFRGSNNMNGSGCMIVVVLLALSSLSCQAFHTVPSPTIFGKDRVGVASVMSSSPAIVPSVAAERNRNPLSLLYGSNNKNDGGSERLVELEEERRNVNKIVRRLAILGALETSYLTFVKLTSKSVAFCATTSDASVSSCNSVLNSPYATIHLSSLWNDSAGMINNNFVSGDIPLPALGALAYSTVAILTITTSTNSTILWTTALSTVMATFSFYLLSLLWFILHQSCTYCYISAALSISMALASWSTINTATTTTDDDDSDIITTTTTTNDTNMMISPKSLANMGISSVLSGTVAALFLFLSVGNVEEASSSMPPSSQELLAANGLPTSSTIVASAQKETALRSPAITTTSSSQAINLAKSLQKLDAKMYGAYWCSHCYEQKQSFGQEAYYNYIRYVECSKDGFESEAKLCKSKDVPGYPTWEIKGKLYPGEQSLEELEEIVEKSL